MLMPKYYFFYIFMKIKMKYAFKLFKTDTLYKTEKLNIL